MPLRYFSDGQEIVMEDFNDLSKALLKDVYDRSFYELIARKEDAFFDDSFKVVYSNSSTVLLKKGLGFQTLAVSSPEVSKKPVYLVADQSITLQTPNAALDRIDLICVKSSVVDEISATRKYKDATTSVISNESFVLQKDWSSDLQVVVGTPNAVPVEPSVPTGYIAVAKILVTAITGIGSSSAIIDLRSIIPVGKNIEIDTTLFSRLMQISNYNLTNLLLEIDSLLPKIINTSSILNNTTLDVGSMTVDLSKGSLFSFKVLITRTVSGSKLIQHGTIDFVFNSVTGLWEKFENFFGDDSVIEFSLPIQIGSTSIYKIQYTSSNMVGAGYSGQIKHQLKDIF